MTVADIPKLKKVHNLKILANFSFCIELNDVKNLLCK